MSLQDKMTPQSPSHLLVNAACLLVCLKFLSQRYAFNSIMREEKIVCLVLIFSFTMIMPWVNMLLHLIHWAFWGGVSSIFLGCMGIRIVGSTQFRVLVHWRIIFFCEPFLTYSFYFPIFISVGNFWWVGIVAVMIIGKAASFYMISSFGDSVIMRIYRCNWCVTSDIKLSRFWRMSY